MLLSVISEEDDEMNVLGYRHQRWVKVEKQRGDAQPFALNIKG